MNKEFVDYKTALALKELGFDEPCFGYYYTLNGKDWKFAEKTEYCRLNDEMDIGGKFTLSVPLKQQAFRWLYQKLGIEKGVMPLDIESQQLLLKELIDKVSSKHSLV